MILTSVEGSLTGGILRTYGVFKPMQAQRRIICLHVVYWTQWCNPTGNIHSHIWRTIVHTECVKADYPRANKQPCSFHCSHTLQPLSAHHKQLRLMSYCFDGSKIISLPGLNRNYYKYNITGNSYIARLNKLVKLISFFIFFLSEKISQTDSNSYYLTLTAWFTWQTDGSGIGWLIDWLNNWMASAESAVIRWLICHCNHVIYYLSHMKDLMSDMQPCR